MGVWDYIFKKIKGQNGLKVMGKRFRVRDDASSVRRTLCHEKCLCETLNVSSMFLFIFFFFY